jgi:hypothetical protein
VESGQELKNVVGEELRLGFWGNFREDFYALNHVDDDGGEKEE